MEQNKNLYANILESINTVLRWAEWYILKAVLRLRIAATSIPVYVTGWCGHGFKSPFAAIFTDMPRGNYF